MIPWDIFKELDFEASAAGPSETHGLQSGLWHFHGMVNSNSIVEDACKGEQT